MNTPPDIIAEKVKEFKKKKQSLKDWLYGTIYKQYDTAETVDAVQEDVEEYFSDKWIEEFITQVAEESRREEMPKEAPKSIMLIALQESLKLQAHYAQLLNDWDGGERKIFRSVSQWLDRLRETGTFSTLTKKESCACFCHIPESKGELKLICTRCNHQVSGECKYTQSKKEKHNG